MQKEVARELGVDEMSIVNWEKDRKPSRRHLTKLLQFFGIEGKALLEYKELFNSRQQKLIEAIQKSK